MPTFRTMLTALVACGSDPPTEPPPTDSDNPTATADTGPTGPGTSAETGRPPTAITLTEGPEVTTPNPAAPLGRMLHACGDVETSAVLGVDDGEEPFDVHSTAPAVCHDLEVLGLRPERTYTLSLTLTAPGDELVVDAGQVITEPLPTPFPTIALRALDEARTEPGVRFFNVEGDRAYLVGVDERARIVWLLVDFNAEDVDLLLPERHLLVQGGKDIQEIDLFGRVVRRWVVEAQAEKGDIPLQIPALSHELVAGANGTFFTTVRRPWPVEGYPASYTDPSLTQDTTIADNQLVEVDQATGATVWGLLVGDSLDRTRIGYDGLRFEFVGLDWGHVNAIQPLDAEGAFLLSLRTQDAVLKMDRDGTIAWIHAPPANWPPALAAKLLTPVGQPFAPSYHQHGASFDEATGALLMFDNGNERASPLTAERPLGDLETWSRLVEFHVDEGARTVSQTWSFEDPIDGRLYADSRGDADRLPGGNVWGTYASVRAMGGRSLQSQGRKEPSIRLIELAFDPDPVEVMDLELYAPLDAPEEAWHSYRSVHASAPFPR